MGYYTEYNILVTLRRDTPDEIIDTLFHLIYGDDETVDRLAPHSLKDIYKHKLLTSRPTFNHDLFSLERSNGMRIFGYFADCDKPYIQPRWEDWGDYKDHKIQNMDYKPYWDVRICGDLNYGFDAIHQAVQYLGPYLVSHKPKQYVGWYQSEDQTERINLYYKRT